MDYKKLSRITDSANPVGLDEYFKSLGLLNEDGTLDKKGVFQAFQAAGVDFGKYASFKKGDYEIEPIAEQHFILKNVSPEEAEELDRKTAEAAAQAWINSVTDEDLEDFEGWDVEKDKPIPMTAERWNSLTDEEKLEYQGDKDGPFNYSQYDPETKEYTVDITWVR